MDSNYQGAQELGLAPLPVTHKGRATSRWLRCLLWCGVAWRDFLYLILPAECVVCEREDHSLCPACASALRRQTASPFRAEDAADALVSVLGDCQLPVVAAGEYRDTLAAAILAYKNHGRTELRAPLSRCLARGLWYALGNIALCQPILAKGNSPGQLWLVPIPSTGSGWRRRGYDPVALLLQSMVREGRVPPAVVIAPVLGIRAKLPWHRRHQKGLGRAARRRNVRNTMKIHRRGGRNFRLSANPWSQGVVLVDDVLTTGSTLREAARTLEQAGLKVRMAVVLAAARAPDYSSKNVGAKGLAENSLVVKDE
ncbi:phosphoribosyltransferase family protein [Arthrobacter sp. TMP15]|uniref:ComF family protein n=1 Tax=Arthrobacter sp. TMP15 TaxID=3140789 RepID=UPI0031BA4637